MGERGENASMFVDDVGKTTFLSFVCSCDGDTGCEVEVADARTGMGERCENAYVLSWTGYAGTVCH